MKMITETVQRIKQLLVARKSDFLLIIVVTLSGVISFGLGRLSVSVPQKNAIILEESASFNSTTTSSLRNGQSVLADQGNYLASKNGTKYYPKGCSAGQRIKEDNRIWFITSAEAEKAGFTTTTLCKY